MAGALGKWLAGGERGLRPPGLEFRILCLEGSVISLISPSPGGYPGPIKPICAQKWPKARFISFFSDIEEAQLGFLKLGVSVSNKKSCNLY